ncbi:hypothetical protein [Pseudomonas asplenii]|uniref:hypothetical protein n=1 Tax=Pseudomonas asplenii TaxID=53407 RepID=UPI00037A370A|nr:hypothetical protein [Pseudomonas fuscovaginae]
MKRIVATASIWLSMLGTACIAGDYSVPQESRSFMRGYKYDYPGCSVLWHEGKETFLTIGNDCEKISSEKMKADAMKSIAYVRKNSSAQNFEDYYSLTSKAAQSYTRQQANQDAGQIWLSGCSDYKNGMNAGDLGGWLKVGDIAKSYPQIKSIAANRLYMDGWNIARGLGGVINCQEMAPYRSADYVSGVDIRKAE